MVNSFVSMIIQQADCGNFNKNSNGAPDIIIQAYVSRPVIGGVDGAFKAAQAIQLLGD
jgi:hypothetical protein